MPRSLCKLKQFFPSHFSTSFPNPSMTFSEYDAIEMFVLCALSYIGVIDLNCDLIGVENWHPKAK